jgi:hypothetical protein
MSLAIGAIFGICLAPVVLEGLTGQFWPALLIASFTPHNDVDVSEVPPTPALRLGGADCGGNRTQKISLIIGFRLEVRGEAPCSC